MAEDRWYSVAVPILQYMHETAGPQTLIPIWQVTDATGIDVNEVSVELDRLIAAGYLVGPLTKLMAGGEPSNWFIANGLGERGLREVGAWPSNDPYEALVELLDHRIATTSDPAERSRLAAFKSCAAEVGKGTIVAILTQLATGGLHF